MQAYTAFIKPRDLDWSWRTFGEYLDYLERHGVFMNTVPLAAHGALRIAVMGFEARAPNDEELARMKRHLHECMESGAYGVSCGLIYAPGMFASTDELAALADVLPPYQGIFAFHIRGSSETLAQAAEEGVQHANCLLEPIYADRVGIERHACAFVFFAQEAGTQAELEATT
jgi:N-acyl-D-amino-acid deacylase